MAEEAGLKAGQSRVSHLKWAFVLGMAIIFVIVLGIISSRALHGIMNKTGSSAESSQTTGSQSGQ
jgi:hypothetical protein